MENKAGKAFRASISYLDLSKCRMPGCQEEGKRSAREIDIVKAS